MAASVPRRTTQDVLIKRVAAGAAFLFCVSCAWFSLYTANQREGHSEANFDRLGIWKLQPAAGKLEEAIVVANQVVLPSESYAACLFHVAGPCVGYPLLAYDTHFFDDEDRGGPPASTQKECAARHQQWIGTCQSDEVYMKFVPGRPGPKTYKTPRLEDTEVAPWGKFRSWQVVQPAIATSSTERYIDLLKRSVLNFIYGCSPPNQNCVSTLPPGWPTVQGGHAGALAMIGWNGMTMVELALRDIIQNGIQGDVIETGVFRGGTCIFMAGVLATLAPHEDRVVWVADSFRGIPPVNLEKYGDYDSAHMGSEEVLVARPLSSLAAVRDSFYQFGLLDENRVQFLTGWFNTSLPIAPIKKLALMRLDGDLFESTWDALINLYPKLSLHGHIIIDDYGDWVGARQAVTIYRKFCGETALLTRFDGVPQPSGGDKQIGKFATWRKTIECQISPDEMNMKLKSNPRPT